MQMVAYEVPFLSNRYKLVWPMRTTSSFAHFGVVVLALLKIHLPHPVCRKIGWMVLSQEWLEEIHYRIFNSIDLDLVMWSTYARERALRDLCETIWEAGMTYDELIERYGDRRTHPAEAMLLETRL
jgi:hypothetical protein